jgi:two-component system sensor histidine kinase KdpD
MTRIRWRSVAIATLSLAIATAAALVLEDFVGASTAAAVFLVAVSVTALTSGAVGAISSSIAAFLLYDFFLIEPRYTLTVRDPAEWLNLFVLLFVGILVGQLAALQRRQTETARARESEARALFRVSRLLATRSSTLAVSGGILDILRDETHAVRVWVLLGDAGGTGRVAADTSPDEPVPQPRSLHSLQRMPGDTPARWVAVHAGSGPPARARTTASPADGGATAAHRIAIEASGRAIGALWITRDRALGRPDQVQSRLLAAAADQLGQALAQDRLADEAREAEISRRSDELKSALLESVSHDIRTPLASIRAAAGTLMDPTLELAPEDRRDSAGTIDAEAAYLDRLVTNMLDLSRIEAGSLRVEREAIDLADPVGRAIQRARPRLAARTIDLLVEAAPPVEADPVLLDQVLANLLENAAKYAAPEARVRVAATVLDDGPVRLTVEDSGPGVPEAELGRLFEKFYRVPGRAGGSRAGTGVGLAVVRGLTEAMGGSVTARRSELGGLAIDVLLPAAESPPP